MNPHHAAAKRLRLQGRSYNEISRALDLSKSTLSIWFRSLKLPDHAQVRLQRRVREGSMRGLLRRNKRQTALASERHVRWRAQARNQMSALSMKDLRLVGTALYWAEGSKRGARHALGFANADPDVIRCMMRFFREVLGVPENKFRLAIHAYVGMDIESTLTFWSRYTGIPRAQFHKTYLGVSRASRRRRSPHRLPYGTAHIKIHDTQQCQHVLGLIEGLASVV